jgi:nucleoside 2-deoxyribosyltransferase
MEKQTIFFAYEGGHPENADAIKFGIKEFNQHQSKLLAKTWEEMEVSGKIINKCITDEIDNCTIFACDLTYLNHNVLFELGYAIGKNKNLLIMLNDTIDGAKARYNNFNILKNVGYETFNNYKNVQCPN